MFLQPILPTLAAKAGALVGGPITNWEQAKTPLHGLPVAPFQHMMQRMDNKKLDAMFSAAAAANAPTPDAATAAAAATPTDSGEPLQKEPLQPTITLEDFQKLDLRVARIVAAEAVPEAKKLLRLTLSLGGNETRNVFAGIKAHYEPNKLVGRLVVMVANLAPRQMKFGLSEGMVVAAGGEGEAYLLSPDSGAKPGHRLH